MRPNGAMRQERACPPMTEAGARADSGILGATMDEPAKVIESLRAAGALKALPIVRTDKRTGALVAADGRELREFEANDGTWVPVGELRDGCVRYLGSASHAGHIELKALYVLVGGAWYSIISGRTERSASRLAPPMLGVCGKEGAR